MHCFTNPVHPRAARLGHVLCGALIATTLLAGAAEPATDVVWRESVAAALTLAGAEYRPVLVMFSSPTCGWCRRLKEEMLGAVGVVELLRQYALAQVDVTRDPDAARQYQVSGVPTLLWLRANGEVSHRLVGYASAETLAQALRQELSPEVVRTQSPEAAEALGRVAAGRPEADDWPALMLAVGRREWHDEVLATIQASTPFPRQALVPLLEHSLLAVRLGGLEVLEAATGDDFGVDPWQPQADASLAGLARWREWAAQAPDAAAEPASRYAPFSPGAVERYLRDLVSEQREHAARALRLLSRAGPEAAPILTTYLEEHPGLPAGARNRVREARILLLLPPLPAVEPAEIARRLVFGTLDVRLAAIASLAAGRAAAVPLLAEFLAVPEASVREAAADALLGTGVLAAVPVLAAHLEHETDREVIHAILRGLGEVKSRRGQALLLTYVTHPDEDLAVAALLSLGRLEVRVAVDGIVPCLADPRWRVRAAALETVAKLRLAAATAAVTRLLDDPDEFIRHAAVKALASAGGKKAAPRLQAAFLADDRLKPAVAAAFSQLEVPLPAAFGPALAGRDPELILGVLQACEEMGQRDLWLPRLFAEHANPDLAAAALRLLAGFGLRDAASRACLLRVLREATSDGLAFTVLDALKVDEESGAALRDDAAPGVPAPMGLSPHAAPTDLGPLASSSPADAVLDAFLQSGPPATPEPAPTAQADAPAGAAADLLSAFGVDAAEQPAATVESRGSASLRELGLAALPYLDPKQPARTQRAAALFVTGLGSHAGLSVLAAGLAQSTATERLQVAERLRLPQAGRLPGVAGLLRVLLDDPDKDVRQAAVTVCLSAGRSALINLPFATLMHPDARLRPWDVLHYWGNTQESGAAITESLRRWAKALVADADPARQTLGLILLERVWQKGDAEVVTPFLTAASPWQRRAAGYALGRRDHSAFQEHFEAIAADPSEHVRLVLPAVYGMRNDRWVDHVDAKHFHSGFLRHYSVRGSTTNQIPLPPALVAALQRLSRDPVPLVRLEAFLCLLERRVSVDLTRLAATLDALPDRAAAAARVAEFMSDNYGQLGPPFKLLLPYIEGTWQADSRRAEFEKHFGVTDDNTAPAAPPPRLLRPDRPPSIAAEFLPEAPPPVAEAAATQPVTLLYFQSPGCSECERVAQLLAELQHAFPTLTVETHSIRKLAAARLNEALCQRFAVPEALRLVTPAVFCSAGPLIRQEITFASLSDKANRSLGRRREDWVSVTDADILEAEQAVQERFAAFRIGVVVGAGLLDGVNPCAFATIIFLLSYLHLTKRRSREIAQVGLAFIAGVFLAYVGLGLGLTEIVARLQPLQQVSHGLNLGLAVFVLIVAILSIRDGVLCLQGRLAAITLQLPDVLKRRIHSVVRTGSRQRHFVLAAFGVGIAISFLELACTGQVYAPTIVFMLQSGHDFSGALRYLLLYNLAFVVPLLLIFALAYGGLRSDSLARFLQGHAAAVKFATAALFLLLFVFFVFGHRLPGLAG